VLIFATCMAIASLEITLEAVQRIVTGVATGKPQAPRMDWTVIVRACVRACVDVCVDVGWMDGCVCVFILFFWGGGRISCGS
jgi:hypothetical protein